MPFFHNVPYAVKLGDNSFLRYIIYKGQSERVGILMLPTFSTKSYLFTSYLSMETCFAAICLHCINFCSPSNLENVSNLHTE